MSVKFDHAVVYNGVFYPANTLIEDKAEEVKPEKEPETVTEKKPEKKAVKKNDGRTGSNAKSRSTNKR